MLSIFAVMNMISQHIEYLVRYNDCVIVPGWGAFIAQYQSASIVAEQNMLMPPVRTLVFNPSLSHDDGLLASSIARRFGMSYDVAMKRISEDVYAMKHQLNIGGEIVLPKIGVFRQNEADSTMLFEPFINGISNSKYLGLSLIDIKPIKEYRKVAQVEKHRSKQDTIYVPIRRSWVRAVASIIIMLGLGLTLSTPIINNQSNQAAIISSSMTSQINQVEKLKELTGNEKLVLNILDTIDSKASVDIKKRQEYQAFVLENKLCNEHKDMSNGLNKNKSSKDVINSKEAINNIDLEIQLSEEDRYCLIIASLPTKKMAEEYILESKEKLALLEKDGRFRIYALTGKTPKETLSLAKEKGLTQRYPKAWVCKK